MRACSTVRELQSSRQQSLSRNGETLTRHVNDEIHAPMGGVRDSGWGRTGPRSRDDFSDVIWINSHSGQRQYPF
jgi:hypothetical protein